jgi:hypothetical protein
MLLRASVLVGLLLIGLVAGCAGQRRGGEPDAPGQAGAPAPGNGEWQTDACATPRSPAVTHTAGATFPLSDERVDALINKVQADGERRFAAVFAGVEVVPEQVRMIVYRKPSAEFDAYLRAEAGEECVIVRDAAHTQAELAALADRISADMAYWRGRGIAINTVGPKHDGSGVEVGTQNVIAAEVELPRRYGTAVPINVVDQGPIRPLVRPTGPAS